MAIILKEGKTFNPERASKSAGMDLSHGNYYGNIKRVEYDSDEKHCAFQIKIYGSEDARKDKTPPIDMININISTELFDELIGNNGITILRCYELALEHPSLIDWQSDEL